MNEAAVRRLAAAMGLALAGAFALWWLGSTRLALEKGADASRPSAEALQALWLVRGMVVAIVAVRLGALRGWRPAAAAALVLMAPAWPLVVLAWSASTVPWQQVAAAECLLLPGAVALALVGQGLGRTLRRAELAEIIATAIGVTLALALWLMRGALSLSLQ